MIKIASLILCSAFAASSYGATSYGHKSQEMTQAKPVDVVNPYLKKIHIGFDFALRFQSLKHENDGTTKPGNDGQSGTADDETLSDLQPGFTNATGNMNLKMPLTDGMYAYVEAYLSSEHHLEMWMREGYLFIDHFGGTSFDFAAPLMDYLSLKVGQMEINYGDAHFRRTDNGEALRNPFVGNYIIDPNTTEIGMEAMLDVSSYEFLVGYTGGTTKGDNKDGHGFATYSKLAYDTGANANNRFRLSGSIYQVDHSDNGPSSYPTFDGTKSYLYAGNRSGSPYAFLFHADTDAGAILPKTSQDMTAYMINALVVMGPVELFLDYDKVKDKDIDGALSDAKLEETWEQYAADLIYRFNTKTYVGLRHNRAEQLKAEGEDSDKEVWRSQLALGHFLTENALMKLEYVHQEYKNFEEAGDLRSGGEFSGLIAEGSVHF